MAPKIPTVEKKSLLYEIPSFTGLNLTAEHSEMEDSECALLQNYFQEGVRVWKQRGGMAKWNASPVSVGAERIVAIREYLPSAASANARSLIAITKEGSNAKVYIAPYSTKVFTEITGTTILTHSEEWSIIQWLDTLYITNGIEPIQVWTSGTTRVDLAGSGTAGVVKGRYATIWKDRLVIAGNRTDPSAIYFSNVLLPTNFDSANILYAGKNDGDSITALATTGVNTNLGAPTGQLFVLKSRSTWNVIGAIGTASLDMELLSSTIGCVGQRAIIHTPIGLVWVGKDNVYSPTNSGFPVPISLKIKQLFQADAGIFVTSMDLTAGNRIALGYSTSIQHFKMSYRPLGAATNTDQVWCYTGSSGTNTDNPNLAWCGVMKGQAISCFWEDSDRNQLGASDNSGYIYILDSGFTDDGVALTTRLVTKNFDLGLSNIEKLFRKFKWKFDLYGNTNITCTANINYATNYGQGQNMVLAGAMWDSGIFDSALWGTTNMLVGYTGRLPAFVGTNMYLDLQGTNNTTNQHEVIDLLLEFQKKRDTFLW